MTNNKSLYTGLGFLVVVAMFSGAYSIYDKASHSGTSPVANVDPQIAVRDAQLDAAYAKISSENLTRKAGDPNLLSALQTFEDIASNEGFPAYQRVRALNGINYAYTQSNYDAADVRDVIFSKPPFGPYYTAPTSNKVDPLRPQSGPDVAAVEAALVKLNAFSISVSPTSYALTRMEVATIFAYRRDSAGLSADQSHALMVAAANKVKDLIVADDALPPLEIFKGYETFPARIQIMYLQATALEFVGEANNDNASLDKGEALFKQILDQGDAYTKANPTAPSILSPLLLTRILYATHYWNRYKNTDPQHIKDILQPLVSDPNAKDTSTYKNYLPGGKNATVSPFSDLRDIAKQMPELKTFLQGDGWKF